jgi:hypothetical protein
VQAQVVPRVPVLVQVLDSLDSSQVSVARLVLVALPPAPSVAVLVAQSTAALRVALMDLSVPALVVPLEEVLQAP